MKSVFILFSVLLNSVFTYGSEIVFPEIEGFTKEVNNQVYNPGNLYDLIDGAADMYLEYEFVDLHLCKYRKEDITISVEAYNQNNPENAFGVYSSERSYEYNYIEAGAEGYMESSMINFFQDNYYIKISGYSESGAVLENELKSVAQSIEVAIGGTMEMPEIIKKMPAENKVAHSEGFANNNYLGYSFLSKVYTALYINGTEYSFFVIEHKTSGEALGTLKKYMDFADIVYDNIKEGFYEIDDKYSGKVYLFLSDKYLLGAMNCNNASIAKENFSAFLKQ